MAAGSNAPVIIKRKKIIQGGGHHGGAWKVAYADFVTAMMAFFMLMWLLNATTEKQRKGLADYFNPTIPVNRISGGGDGAFGGTSIFAETTMAENGAAPNPLETSGADQEAFEELEQILRGRGGESMVTDLMARHITTRLTDEGLIVELFDIEGAPLFVPGTADPEPVMQDLAAMLTRVFSLVRNDMAVNGHVQAAPEVLRVNPTWDLSTERAQVARSLLEGEGVVSDRMRRVTGHADRKPVAPNPMAVRNNRLEVILLRSDTG